jgi:hypothetical protein
MTYELPEQLRTPEGRCEFFSKARKRLRGGEGSDELVREEPEAHRSRSHVAVIDDRGEVLLSRRIVNDPATFLGRAGGDRW